MKQFKHWQDPANVVLGAWLVLSPWVLGFSRDTMAMSNAVIIGATIVATAFGAILVPRAWEEWTEAALGLWMMASPWILGFSGSRNAMSAAVGTGVVILVLALWALLTDEDYSHWLRQRLLH